MAQAFDLADLTNRAGAPSLRVLCEGAGTTNACSDGLCDSIPKRNPRPALIDSDWTSLPQKIKTITAPAYNYDAFGNRTMQFSTTPSVYNEYVVDLSGRAITAIQPGTSNVYTAEVFAGGRHWVTDNGSALFLGTDWLGTTRALTNLSGTFDQLYTSLPWGDGLSSGGSSFHTTSQYTGKEYDPESGLYHFPARQYAPVQGRWLTPDPAGISAMSLDSPQSWNRYAYVLNNPLSNVDPTGLYPGGYCDTADAGCSGDGGVGGPGGDSTCDAMGNCIDYSFEAAAQFLAFEAPYASFFNDQIPSFDFHTDGNGFVVGDFAGETYCQAGFSGCTIWNPGTQQWEVAGANNGAANNSNAPACNSTTGICVPKSMIPPPGYSPVKNAVKWYLCGNGSFDNIKNYTLEGFTKGVIVGGIAGWEGGPPGVALGALGGGVEGFFGGNAVGWVATAGCQAAGMYGPAS